MLGMFSSCGYAMADSDEQYQKYLRHQKGMALLWMWMEQWSGLKGWSWSADQSLLVLSELSSQRFVFGAPLKKGPQAKHLFLGSQSDESAWIRRIQWKRVVWDQEQSRLWLVSPHFSSPDEKWPDLPGFAVGIFVDGSRLTSWKGNKLDLRNIWWDDDHRFHVDMACQGSLPVRRTSLNEGFSASERQNIKSLRDLVIERLNKSSVFVDPGYAGKPADLSKDQMKLVEPFHDQSGSKPIESEYPELFGQFLDQPPSSPPR